MNTYWQDVDVRDAFFDELYNIASKDHNVMFLTGDMGAFSLEKFRKDLSSQYINVGIAEQNMVGVAAGLALGGKTVFIYTITPFVTLRCYEHIKIDLCFHNLPVTVIGVGTGFTYGTDGPTHYAIDDLAIMRVLPRITIFNPSDAVLTAASAMLAYETPGPVYVRIDKGNFPVLYQDKEDFSDGLALLKEGRDLIIVTTGVMVHQAFQVADELAKHSVDAGVMDIYRVKPINEELFLSLIGQTNRLVTLEEDLLTSGIGSAVSEILVDRQKTLSVKRIGVPEQHFARYGEREWMHSLLHLDVNSVTNTILNWKG